MVAEVDFYCKEKGIRLLGHASMALNYITGVMFQSELDPQHFDELLQASKCLIDLLGEGRHLWGPPSTTDGGSEHGK